MIGPETERGREYMRRHKADGSEQQGGEGRTASAKGCSFKYVSHSASLNRASWPRLEALFTPFAGREKCAASLLARNLRKLTAPTELGVGWTGPAYWRIPSFQAT